jgi:uncharacterized RDD family membrane protein YckC
MAKNEKYAGFFIRFLAGIIDTLILIPFLIILTFLFGFDGYQIVQTSVGKEMILENNSPLNNQLIDLSFYIICLIYLTYFLASKSQATIGKKITKIYVGNFDGSKLSLQKSLLRSLVAVLTAFTLGIGFLIVIFHKEKAALHDIICKTRVFHKK